MVTKLIVQLRSKVEYLFLIVCIFVIIIVNFGLENTPKKKKKKKKNLR